MIRAPTGHRSLMIVSPRLQPYLIAALACLALATSAGYDLYRERALEIQTARSQTAALARLLEAHIHQMMRRADSELDDLARRTVTSVPALPTDGFFTSAEVAPDAGAAANSWLGRLQRSEPGLLIVDRARQDASGAWRLVVGKRIRQPEGRPAVPWQAQIDLRPLQRLLDAADTRNNGFATLFSDAGWLLATAPRNDALFERNWGDTPMFKEHLPREAQGTVQQVVVRDGTERLYSYRRISGYPLVISAGISMTDALAAWRERLKWNGLLLALASLAFFVGAFGLSHSIRRREQAQQAALAARNQAQLSESFLRKLTDSLPLRIAYVDTDLRYRFVNRKHCQRFGLEREQILGRTRQELTGRELPPELAQAIAQVLRGEDQSFEIEETDADGHRRALATLLVSDRDDAGRVQGFHAASLDVTERFEQRQRLDAALKERETLLREVYHRVKNNLQVIQSLLRLQRRTVSDLAAQVALDESARRVRAMALVHEKLYQSGSLEAVSLREYTLELLEFIGETTGAHQRGIPLLADVPTADVGLDTAIPYGLLVNELISNSLKHGFPAGRRGTVRLQVKRTARSLRLSVSDDGAGLPEGFTLDRDASMGLQLAISLAAQLGGQLQARNDGGAVFSADISAFD